MKFSTVLTVVSQLVRMFRSPSNVTTWYEEAGKLKRDMLDRALMYYEDQSPEKVSVLTIMKSFESYSLLHDNQMQDVLTEWSAEAVERHKGLALHLSRLARRVKPKFSLDFHTETAQRASFNYFVINMYFQLMGDTLLIRAYSIQGHPYKARCFEMLERLRMQLQLRLIKKTVDHSIPCCVRPPTSMDSYFTFNSSGQGDIAFFYPKPLVVDYKNDYVISGIATINYSPYVLELVIEQTKLPSLLGLVSRQTKWTFRMEPKMNPLQLSEHSGFDLGIIFLPEEEVAVGVELYLKRNKLAIKVLSAKVDYLNGRVLKDTVHWVESNTDGPMASLEEVQKISKVPTAVRPAGPVTGMGFELINGQLYIKFRDTLDIPNNCKKCATTKAATAGGSFADCCGWEKQTVPRTCSKKRLESG